MNRDRLAELIGRDPRREPASSEPRILPGRRVLVSGAAGSVGSEICRQLLSRGIAALTMVDVAESALYLQWRRLEREFPGATVRAEVADIRDARRIERLVRRAVPHDVFHAAALKQVPLMEASPAEAVRTNVFGTDRLVAATIGAGAERFVYISTDKAVRPESVMGVTKRIGEWIVRDRGRGASTRCCAVRFGNVLGSSGSVVAVFDEQIGAGGPVTVTDPDATRYFMTLDEAVALVLRAGYGDLGPLCVLDMGRPVRIVDLARRMIRARGLEPDVDVKLEFVGLRPGEKRSESLLGDGESLAPTAVERIGVVRGPEPPPELRARLSELAAAIEADHDDRLLTLLARLVPDYRPLGMTTRPAPRASSRSPRESTP